MDNEENKGIKESIAVSNKILNMDNASAQENALTLSLITTGSDYYGCFDTPIEVGMKIYSNDSKDMDKKSMLSYIKTDEPITFSSFMKYGLTHERIDIMNPIQDERYFRNIHDFMGKLNRTRIFLVGFCLKHEIDALNRQFMRFGLSEIVWNKDRVIDLQDACKIMINYKKIGSYDLDACCYALKLKTIEDKDNCLEYCSTYKQMIFKIMEMNNLNTFSDVYGFIHQERDVDEFTFGKHKGENVADVIKSDENYISWLRSNKIMGESYPNLLRSIERMIAGNLNDPVSELPF